MTTATKFTPLQHHVKHQKVPIPPWKHRPQFHKMNTKKQFAILRTHGGLGNQLFQILFGRLFSKHYDLQLRELHELRYRNSFFRSTILSNGGAPHTLQSVVSAARIPKILQRLSGKELGVWRLGRSFYLDGYFQNAEAYEKFMTRDIAAELNALAAELAIDRADIDNCLVHLRLGDFFSNRMLAMNHVLERLKTVPEGAHIITNDEQLLADSKVITVMASRNAHLVSTQGMTAEEVLRTMARYKHIDANDSTLAFWSSVLGGCNVFLRDKRLSNCRDLLISSHTIH